MEYKQVKLGKIIEFKNGKKNPKENGNIPIYGGNGILGYTNKSNSQRDSIIIGRVGAYCGCVYKNDNECWISDNAIVGYAKENNSYLYLYYCLQALNLNNLHIGSSHPLITQDILNNIEINIPCYSEQLKIGKILSNIDKKIELNNQINNNLQELCNTVFVKWFCNYDFPDMDKHPYKSSGGRMVESELGKIPEKWTIGIFQDIIDFSNGYGFKSKDLLDNAGKNTFKVFKQGNINISGGINEEKTKSWYYKDKSKGLENYILKKGDILMCMTDMKNSTSPLLGHTALMNVDNEYIVNQRVGLIRCKKEIVDYPYVYTMSNLEYFLKDIRSRANSGVQVNLSTKCICETKIIIPSIG